MKENSERRGMKSITIKLPFPLPTWNRVIAMHYMARKELRDCTDKLVDIYTSNGINVKDIPMWNSLETLFLLEKYEKLIRPKKMPKMRKKNQVKRFSTRKKK